MPTWAILLSILLTAGAFCVSVLALARANRAYAEAVNANFKLSAVEKSERLTPSKLAELSEFREALSRAEELLLKVNRREIARAKVRSEDGTFTVNNAASLKDQLRARAGLRAGQPAPHQ